MPPVNKLQFDASGAETVLNQVTAALRDQNAAITEISSSYGRFGKTGKLLEAAFKGIAGGATSFTAVVTNSKKGLQVVEVQARQTAAALEKLQKSQKSITGISQAAIAQPKLIADLQLSPRVSNLDKASFDRLTAQALSGVKSGDVSAKEFDNIFRLVRAGNKQMLDGVLEDTRQGIIRVIKEYDKLQEGARKAASKSQGNKFAPQVQPTLNNALGNIPTNISTTGLTRVEAAVRNIQNVFKSGQLSQQQFAQVISDSVAGTGRVYDGAAGKVQRYVSTIQNEYKKAEAAAKKMADSQSEIGKRNLAASAATAQINKTFNFSGLNTSQLEKVYAQVSRIQNLLTNGKLDFSQFTNSLRAFQTGVGPLKGAEETVRASLVRIDQATKTTAQSFDGLGLAYKLLVVQLGTEYVSRVVDQFKQITASAAEFQQQIALLQTLSQDSSLSFQDWSEGIVKASNRLGVGTDKISSAAYDLLSNQITTGGDTFKTLDIAGDFARVTDSGIEDSVNLISSAINAYRLSAADASDISAKFFTAIDLGRLKAGDLANTFGRVATTAKSLGVDLGETLSLLTVITRQGIQPDTAQTLLTNVFQKLLRPTKELQTVYDELGVGSGELFVKTYGIIGALEKLQQVTGSSKSRLAEFFNEIRGFQGGNILIDRFDEVKKDFEVISKAVSGSTYTKGVELVTDNYGQKFKQQTTEITNFFKTEFETKVLKTVIDFTSKFGGMAKVVTTLIPIIAGLVGAFALKSAIAGVLSLAAAHGGLTASIVAATIAAKGLAVAFLMNPATWIAGAVVGIGVIAYKAMQASEEFKKWPEEIRRANEAMKAEYLTGVDQRLNDVKNKFTEASQGGEQKYLQFLAGYSQELTKVRSKESEAAVELRTGLNAELDVLSNNAKKAGSELEQAMGRAKAAAKDAAKAMRDLQVDAVDRWAQRATKRNDVNMTNARTDASLNGKDPELAANAVDRSDEIARQQLDFANKKADIALRANDVHSVLEAFKSINSIMDEMANKTQKTPIFGLNGQFTGKYREQFKVDPNTSEANITAEYERQLKVLDQIRQKKLQEAELGRQQLETNKRLVAAMQDLANKIGKFNPFDKGGDLKDNYKSGADALKELIALQATFNKLASEMNGTNNGKTNASKTFSEQLQRIQGLFGQQQSSVTKETDTQQMQSDIKAAQEGITTATENANRAMEKNIALAHEAEKTWVEAFAKYRAGAEQALRFQLSTDDNSIGGKLARGKIGSAALGTEFNAPFPATKALQNMDAAAQTGDITKARQELERFEQIYQNIGRLTAQMQAGENGGPGKTAQQVVNNIRAQFDALEAAQKAKASANQAVQQQSGSLQGVDSVAANLENRFGALGSAATNFGAQAQSGAEQAKSSIASLIGVVQEAIAALNAMQARATQAAAAAKSAASSAGSSGGGGGDDSDIIFERLGGPLTYARNGFLSDFASGAFRKGTDVLPIMANRRETIMNEDASRRFFPQLMAMNRGIDPSQQNVSNNNTTNIGGINVAVAGGDTGKATVSEIVGGINRAARRGSIKIGRS